MKKLLKNFIRINFAILIFCIAIFNVSANQGGNQGNTGGDATGANNYYTSDCDSGIRVTMYVYKKNSNNPERISNSVDFRYAHNGNGCNNSHSSANADRINNQAYSSGKSKIDYLKGQSPSFKKGSNTISLAFPLIIGSRGNPDSFRPWFLNKYVEPQDDNYVSPDGEWLQRTLEMQHTKLDSGDYDGYYYVVEPLMLYYMGGRYYWVTPYEAAWLKLNNNFSTNMIITWLTTNFPNFVKVTTQYGSDKNGFIGDNSSNGFAYKVTPNKVKPGPNRASDTQALQAVISREGWGMGIYWKNYAFFCKEHSNFFPIDSSTGRVSNVKITGNGVNDVHADPNGVNCCDQVLASIYKNDTTTFYEKYPMCAPRTCQPNLEENPATCGDEGNYYQRADQYCIKAAGQYSQYLKRTINNYARIVCKEEMNVIFPRELKKAQSVGTYMVWPTAKNIGVNHDHNFTFNGKMFCYLSLDSAFIDNNESNPSGVYNSILNTIKSYVSGCDIGNCTAKEWYRMNNNISMQLSYNDDEYGGQKVNLVLDQSNTIVTSNVNSLQANYKSLNNLLITISTTANYRLEDNTYKKLTTSPGNGNLSNMFDNINKNNYVNQLIKYPILPISYKATTWRNAKNIPNIRYSNPRDAYALTIYFSKFGDNGKFANQEQRYTCNYEVTYAPPRETGENPGVDNNDLGLDDPVNDCSCNSVLPDGTTCPAEYKGMDLTGYIAKNPGMTCNQAQLTYCKTARGNMNVEYRVIDLKNPFPGITGLAYPASRRIGSNWRESLNQYNVIDNANTMVNRYIRNNRGVSDYNVYTHPNGPLYVIELDNAKIHAIRAYNKANDYSNFDMNCMDSQFPGRKCTSNFLRNNGLLQSGSCAGTLTESNFNSCADKLETTPRGPLDLRGVHS